MNKINADLKFPLIDLEVGNTTTGGKQDNSVQPERLSEENNMYCLYWIHLKEHRNILNEGYIGITKNFKERLKDHKKSKRLSIFKNAINKYGWNNLIKEIIFHNLTIEQALKLENKFRPKQRMGWNCQKGGELGVESEWYLISDNKLKHSKATSDATKKGIAKKDTKENRSIRAKTCRINHPNSYLNANLGSKNPRAILNENQVKYIKFTLLKIMKLSEIAKLYNVSSYIIWSIKSERSWKHIICDSPDHNK